MDDLTRVHQVNLQMLKEIDRICRKHRLNYVLDAGTLIGAVRHRGFVPWDDDADVAMTRKNFDAFLKAAPCELPPEMELVMPDEYHGGKCFYDFTPRIIYKNSSTHKKDDPEMAFYEGKINHLWVDIFVLDNLPDSRVNAFLTKGLQAVIYGLAMGHRYRLDYEKYSFPAKLAVGVLAAAGRLIPMKWIYAVQQKLAVKDQKKKTKRLYYSNYQPDFLYVTIPKAWSMNVTELPFAGTELMCPKEWHKVLTEVYGDYRKLPPKEKRVPSHCTEKIQIWD